MFFRNIILYCVLILFPKVAISNEGQKKSSKGSDDEVKHTFAKLLKTIVKVNEERMQAMDKITRLQDYMLTKNKLKTDEDIYDSMEEEDNRVLLAFANVPLLRRAEDETITRAMCKRFYLERTPGHLRTGPFLKMACHSHSVGLCESACKKSVTKLCDKFHCSHVTRTDSKSECHVNCNNFFERDEN